MLSFEQLTQAALSLPSAALRALLAEKLIESLELNTDLAIQAAWITEAKKRRDEVRNGTINPISGDEALAQVRRMLEQ